MTAVRSHRRENGSERKRKRTERTARDLHAGTVCVRCGKRPDLSVISEREATPPGSACETVFSLTRTLKPADRVNRWQCYGREEAGGTRPGCDAEQ
ncbi:hypothetical protein AOLI_G00254210 [Acnodon oligacanthus]